MVVNLKDIFKKYYIHLIFVLLLLAIYISNQHFNNVIDENNILFDTSNICGRINDVKTHKLGTIVVMKHEKVEYYFRDRTVYEKQIPKDKWVYDIAEKGDSIYKAAYSDTLFLYKQNGKNYFFVFDRDELYW